MGRTMGAVLGGFATWAVLASLCNRLMRLGLEGYAEAEKVSQFTVAMMATRLASAALAQLAAGAVAARLAPAEPRTPLYTGLALLALFIPVHIHIWEHFPLWYHALFLTTLAPLVVLGGRLARR